MTTNRAGFIAGLRALADLYETDPQVPLPAETHHFLISSVHTVEQFEDVSSRLGDVSTSKYDGGEQRYVIARRDFGPGVAVEVWTATELIEVDA